MWEPDYLRLQQKLNAREAARTVVIPSMDINTLVKMAMLDVRSCPQCAIGVIKVGGCSYVLCSLALADQVV